MKLLQHTVEVRDLLVLVREPDPLVRPSELGKPDKVSFCARDTKLSIAASC